MPRRTILDVEWMRRARAEAWAVNYECREFAKSMGDGYCEKVLRVLDRFGFPMPVMEISGWLDKEESGLIVSETVRLACEAARLPLANYPRLARWYWSAEDWQVYVSAFNQLPDPQGKYTFFWNGRLMPKVVPIGDVDNLGVSGGNSAFTPVPRELVERGLRRK